MAIVFIIPKSEGYVVETEGGKVLHTAIRQETAIKWARDNDHSPHVARVRHLTDKKIPDHWRSV